MKLNTEDLQHLQDLAIYAADKAGEIILSYADQVFDVYNKIDTKGADKVGDSLAAQVFTEADLKSQECIVDVLKPTLEKYDLGLLAEESDDDLSRLSKDYFWCIDPMDGTLAFTEGEAGYSVVISLVSREGEAIIGVVYDPLTDNTYHAIKGQGARLNGEPFILPEASTEALTLVADRSFTEEETFMPTMKALEAYGKELGLPTLNLIQQGGAIMSAIWVLEQQPACYFKFPKEIQGGGHFWDFAATTCIFNELGYTVQDFTGQKPDLNRADTTFMNEKGMLFTSGKDHTLLATKISRLID